MRRRLFRSLALVGVLAVSSTMLVGIAAAGDNDPDPLAILPGRGVTEQLGLGTDTVTIWICDVGDASPPSFTLADVVAWANADVAPFFDEISRGRLAVDFVGGGEFAAAEADCLNEGISRTTTSNAMTITRAGSIGGFGGSGLAAVDAGQVLAGSLADAARDTLRGFLVGGGTYELPATTAHELGHTLTWPHSGSTNSGFATSDYDNQYDLMSGAATTSAADGFDNFCASIGPCEIIHTIAVNRYASGWIDVDQIELVLRPLDDVELDAPGTAGTQLALIPTADPLVFHTVEARPNVGYDASLPKGGVVVHTLDLRSDCDGPWSICWGSTRRQQPAVPAIDSSAHVLGVGEALTLSGVTVSVEAATAGGFRVDFIGAPAGCGLGVGPFADVNPASFAYGPINCIRLLEITNGTSATTYSPAANVTREQMAAFLARLWRALDNACSTSPTPFTDLGDSFAGADVACIYDLEVTNGTTATTYGPAANVTRAQMAAFLGRLWRALGNTCSAEPAPFTDVATTSFAFDDVACIYHLGITTGTSPSTYSPGANVTREQMAAFLERFFRAAIAA